MKGKYRILGGRLWGGHNLITYELCFTFWGSQGQSRVKRSRLRGRLAWRPEAGKDVAHWRKGQRPCEEGELCQMQWEKQATWTACRAPRALYLSRSSLLTTEHTHHSWSRKGLYWKILRHWKSIQVSQRVRLGGQEAKTVLWTATPWVESAEGLCCCLQV